MTDAKQPVTVEQRACDLLASAYEDAGYPKEAAAFRAGPWTCHDHPAKAAVEAALTLPPKPVVEREAIVEALYDAALADVHKKKRASRFGHLTKPDISKLADAILALLDARS